LSFKATVFEDLIKDELEKGSRDILLKVSFINATYNAFIVNELEKILNDEIIKPIQDKILMEGFSPKIASSTRIAKTPVATGPGRITWTIISEYTAINGFPVAVMIEEGRKAYVIVPIRAQALHWVDKESGEDVFAKRAKIPRFRPRKFVQNTIRERTPLVQEKVDLATQRYVDDIMTDTTIP